MQISCLVLCCLALVLQSSASSADHKHHKHHKGHHKHHHGKHHKDSTKAAPVPAEAAPVAAKVATPPAAAVQATAAKKAVTDDKLVAKMKELEQRLSKKQNAIKDGNLLVNGPLPADFNERFAQAVAQATGVDAAKVSVTKSSAVEGEDGIFEIDFKAPAKTVSSVQVQSTNPDSKLAKGNLHSFLVAKDDEDESEAESPDLKSGSSEPSEAATPVEDKGLDIDTAMPYGELEPFGREDTAQELTEDSVSESNSMVDQLERAEVAEEKRAVFRSLTRLRGAAITSFDGVARSQTGNIDEYNKIHQWRKTHPLHHLADEESDVSKWAFPDNADF